VSAALRWLFTTPSRLYGTVGALICLMVIFMVVVIGVRVATLPVAPRNAGAQATERAFPDDNVTEVPVDLVKPGNLEEAAMASVAEDGHGKPVSAKVTARDGLVQVVEVTTSTGEVGEVILTTDGPTFVKDSVTWRKP
jgi:hypothetical protein